MSDVTIVDYGVGNLQSVCNALVHVGATVEVTSSPDKVLQAKRLVLPGVGAFANAMAELEKRNLIEPIKQVAFANKPFLGICLGMQLMMDSSEEFGFQQGLGLIAGSVKEIPTEGPDGRKHKVPHIGWNGLLLTANDWGKTIFAGLTEGDETYFVHSFVAHPLHQENCLAICDYYEMHLTAAVQSGNMYGCQFHPEKSGEVGLKILRNFMDL